MDSLVPLPYRAKIYSEQILEPSQVYEFHSILKAHVKNIILFYTELVYYAIHSALVEYSPVFRIEVEYN
jgi:hypothetical protein